MYYVNNIFHIVIDYIILYICSLLSTLVNTFSVVSNDDKIMITNNSDTPYLLPWLSVWLISVVQGPISQIQRPTAA